MGNAIKRAAFMAAAVLAVNLAVAQNSAVQRFAGQKPIAEKIITLDTSLFTTKKIFAETPWDTAAAKKAGKLVDALEKYLGGGNGDAVKKLKKRLARCSGEEFAKKAIASRGIFFRGYGMNEWNFLSEALETGKADCSNMTAIYFTVAKELGKRPKVAFSEEEITRHVFLIVDGYCLSLERGEWFPIADINKHYTVYSITDDENAILAIAYNNRGYKAELEGDAYEAAGDTAAARANFGKAVGWTKKAIGVLPGVPLLYENLGRHYWKLGMMEESEAANRMCQALKEEKRKPGPEEARAPIPLW